VQGEVSLIFIDVRDNANLRKSSLAGSDVKDIAWLYYFRRS